MTALSTAWTKHIQDPKAKADFEAILRNNTQLFTRLAQIIEERAREYQNKSFSESDFSDPNWSHKQAARLGRLSELKWLKEILP